MLYKARSCASARRLCIVLEEVTALKEVGDERAVSSRIQGPLAVIALIYVHEEIGQARLQTWKTAAQFQLRPYTVRNHGATIP